MKDYEDLKKEKALMLESFEKSLDKSQYRYHKDRWIIPLGWFLITLNLGLFIFNVIEKQFLSAAFSGLCFGLVLWSNIRFIKSRRKLIKVIRNTLNIIYGEGDYNDK